MDSYNIFSMPFRLNDKNTHLIVMYHYIEDPHPGRSGMHSYSIAEFEYQLALLSQYFHIVSVDEVYRRHRERRTNERLCALTFDDGTKDPYANVLPLLKKHKIPATFFIITKTLNGFIPFTHKIHLLLSLSSATELRKKFHTFLNKSFRDFYKQYYIPEDRHINPKRKYADIVESNLKDTLVIAPPFMRLQFLDWIFSEFKLDETSIAKDFFMNKEQIREMAALGFSIGSHTHSHEALDILSVEDIQNEIMTSKKYLEDIIAAPITSFCYPYGRIGRKKHATISLLLQHNITHAVTIEQRAFIQSEHPLFLPRYRMNNIRGYLHQKAKNLADAARQR